MSPRLMKLAALVAGVLTMPEAQAQSPTTRRAREVVAVINAATPATIRAFVDSAFDDRMRGMPMRAHIDFFMGQREQSRGLDWVEVQDGVVALADPFGLVTNLQLTDAEGHPLPSMQATIHLNEIVHTLPWQSEVQRALHRAAA